MSVGLLDLVDPGNQPSLGHAMILHYIACLTTKGRSTRSLRSSTRLA